jgi:Raf kinase inhibitor-like YbhB/YbcL family protein
MNAYEPKRASIVPLAAVSILLILAASGCGRSTAPAEPAAPSPPPPKASAFTLTLPSISAAQAVPTRYTCDGENVTPALAWSGAPARTRSYTVILHDPDAPGGDFTHWLLVDIPSSRTDLPDGSTGAEYGLPGTNSFGLQAYSGPCPPAGSPPHHYVFELLALDVPTLGLPEGASRSQVEGAVAGHVLARAKQTRMCGR